MAQQLQPGRGDSDLLLRELRQDALRDRWTLASDRKVLRYLQQFSDSLVSRTHRVHQELSDLAFDATSADVALQNTVNSLIMLSNSQFIESRCYDQEDTALADTAHANSADTNAAGGAAGTGATEPGAAPPVSGSNAADTRDLAPIFTAALSTGMGALALYKTPGGAAAHAHAPAPASAATEAAAAPNATSERESTAANILPAVQNRYDTLSLPHVIGTRAFLEDETLGLIIPVEEPINFDEPAAAGGAGNVADDTTDSDSDSSSSDGSSSGSDSDSESATSDMAVEDGPMDSERQSAVSSASSSSESEAEASNHKDDNDGGGSVREANVVAGQEHTASKKVRKRKKKKRKSKTASQDQQNANGKCVGDDDETNGLAEAIEPGNPAAAPERNDDAGSDQPKNFLSQLNQAIGAGPRESRAGSVNSAVAADAKPEQPAEEAGDKKKKKRKKKKKKKHKQGSDSRTGVDDNNDDDADDDADLFGAQDDDDGLFGSPLSKANAAADGKKKIISSGPAFGDLFGGGSGAASESLFGLNEEEDDVIADLDDILGATKKSKKVTAAKDEPAHAAREKETQPEAKAEPEAKKKKVASLGGNLFDDVDEDDDSFGDDRFGNKLAKSKRSGTAAVVSESTKPSIGSSLFGDDDEDDEFDDDDGLLFGSTAAPAKKFVAKKPLAVAAVRGSSLFDDNDEEDVGGESDFVVSAQTVSDAGIAKAVVKKKEKAVGDKFAVATATKASVSPKPKSKEDRKAAVKKMGGFSLFGSDSDEGDDDDDLFSVPKKPNAKKSASVSKEHVVAEKAVSSSVTASATTTVAVGKTKSPKSNENVAEKSAVVKPSSGGLFGDSDDSDDDDAFFGSLKTSKTEVEASTQKMAAASPKAVVGKSTAESSAKKKRDPMGKGAFTVPGGGGAQSQQKIAAAKAVDAAKALSSGNPPKSLFDDDDADPFGVAVSSKVAKGSNLSVDANVDKPKVKSFVKKVPSRKSSNSNPVASQQVSGKDNTASSDSNVPKRKSSGRTGKISSLAQGLSFNPAMLMGGPAPSLQKKRSERAAAAAAAAASEPADLEHATIRRPTVTKTKGRRRRKTAQAFNTDRGPLAGAVGGESKQFIADDSDGDMEHVDGGAADAAASTQSCASLIGGVVALSERRDDIKSPAKVTSVVGEEKDPVLVDDAVAAAVTSGAGSSVPVTEGRTMAPSVNRVLESSFSGGSIDDIFGDDPFGDDDPFAVASKRADTKSAAGPVPKKSAPAATLEPTPEKKSAKKSPTDDLFGDDDDLFGDDDLFS